MAQQCETTQSYGCQVLRPCILLPLQTRTARYLHTRLSMSDTGLQHRQLDCHNTFQQQQYAAPCNLTKQDICRESLYGEGMLMDLMDPLSWVQQQQNQQQDSHYGFSVRLRCQNEFCAHMDSHELYSNSRKSTAHCCKTEPYAHLHGGDAHMGSYGLSSSRPNNSTNTTAAASGNWV